MRGDVERVQDSSSSSLDSTPDPVRGARRRALIFLALSVVVLTGAFLVGDGWILIGLAPLAVGLPGALRAYHQPELAPATTRAEVVDLVLSGRTLPGPPPASTAERRLRIQEALDLLVVDSSRARRAALLGRAAGWTGVVAWSVTGVAGLVSGAGPASTIFFFLLAAVFGVALAIGERWERRRLRAAELLGEELDRLEASPTRPHG